MSYIHFLKNLKEVTYKEYFNSENGLIKNYFVFRHKYSNCKWHSCNSNYKNSNVKILRLLQE